MCFSGDGNYGAIVTPSNLDRLFQAAVVEVTACRVPPTTSRLTLAQNPKHPNWIFVNISAGAPGQRGTPSHAQSAAAAHNSKILVSCQGKHPELCLIRFYRIGCAILTRCSQTARAGLCKVLNDAISAQARGSPGSTAEVAVDAVDSIMRREYDPPSPTFTLHSRTKRLRDQVHRAWARRHSLHHESRRPSCIPPKRFR